MSIVGVLIAFDGAVGGQAIHIRSRREAILLNGTLHHAVPIEMIELMSHSVLPLCGSMEMLWGQALE
ncbi:hypothetical protein [Bordetella genomosp. 1]|uniref:hypothetical protein n=1 Tax=Bordetella genomosp. 1 TaxID=1395607 RepID=UPI0015957449|nr:hypothetical protein [Bordetella genomosp. 1]